MTANIHGGLNLDEIAHVTPTAQQIRELNQLGFTTGVGENGWHAWVEVGSYRVQITPHGRGWRVSNIRDGVHVEAEYHPVDLTDAVNLAEDMSLEVELVDALTALISAEVRAELRRAA